MQVPIAATDIEDPPPPSPPTASSILGSSFVVPACHMDPTTFQSTPSITDAAFYGFCDIGLPNQLCATNFPGLPLNPFNGFGMANSTHAAQMAPPALFAQSNPASRTPKFNWRYYFLLVFSCHNFLKLVWVRRQFLHHIPRQETCGLSKIFYDQHLRDY